MEGTDALSVNTLSSGERRSISVTGPTCSCTSQVRLLTLCGLWRALRELDLGVGIRVVARVFEERCIHVH